MRAEDWKSFKAGGFKLFKEGHVQNIFINIDDTKLEVEYKCLPEMKKDRVYNLSLRISVETSSNDFAKCSCSAGRQLQAYSSNIICVRKLLLIL